MQKFFRTRGLDKYPRERFEMIFNEFLSTYGLESWSLNMHQAPGDVIRVESTDPAGQVLKRDLLLSQDAPNELSALLHEHHADWTLNRKLRVTTP
jgi:hypothetical protein